MAERVVKVRLTAQIAEYATAMEEAARKTRAVGTETERAAQKREAFQALGTAATVVGGAMTALSLTVAKTGLEYNTLQQASRAALTTLLGGAQAANAQMDKLDAFARTSPFSKQTFITAQQQMLAFGIEAKKVIPYLDAIQDAVAAAGGSNQQLGEVAFVLSQISAAGKITAQDLMQLGQRGINAAELIGVQMGKTGAQIKDEITAGTLGADAALDALTAGMKEKFGGAAANVKDTFAGAMDRVQAAWRDMSADLMKPLVDPNGGGALVGFLNIVADVMRAVQSLPEPIRQAGGALFAVAGITALLAGALIFARLKWIDFKISMEAAGITGTTVRGKLAGIASFLGGPWGLAMLAATAATVAYNAAIQDGIPAQEAIRNSIRTTASAAEGLKSAFERGSVETFFQGDYADALKDLPGLLNHAIEAQDNWAVALATTNSQRGAFDSLKRYGDALAEMSHEDLPRAQLAFRGLVDEFKLNEGQTRQLLDEMGPYRDALMKVAEAHDISADSAEFLQLAMGNLPGSTAEVEAAMAEMKEESDNARDALKGVSDALDAIGGAAMGMGAAKDAAVSALNEMAEAAAAEGAELWDTNAASLKLRDSMRDVERTHRDAAEAIIANGGTLAEAQAEYDKGRDAVLGMLEAKGMDADAAATWADAQLGSAAQVKDQIDQVYQAWLNLPENRETKYEIEAAAAMAQLQALKDNLASIPEYKRITLESFSYGNKDVSIPNAAGGLYENKIKSFAAGGYEPGIYPYQPGGRHKFAEEFAEAYISMDPARRQRSVGVWMQAGQHLGVLGGGVGSAGAESRRPINVTQHITAPPGMSAEQVSAIAADRLDRALRG